MGLLGDRRFSRGLHGRHGRSDGRVHDGTLCRGSGRSLQALTGVCLLGRGNMQHDGTMWGLKVSSGDVLWSTSLGASVQSSPAFANGQVIVGNSDGTFVGFDTGADSTVPIAALA